MQLAHLRQEERFGLAVAAVLHLALLIALAWNAARSPADVPIPERMVVSLADEVSLEDTAPDPATEPQAALAPTLSEEPAPAPEPEPQERVVPPQPAPVPTPRATSRPEPVRTQAPRPQATSRPEPARTQAPEPQQPTRRSGGGSRIGEDFLQGQSSGARSESRGSPAREFGPAEQASLASAISRQLRPHWNAPQGLDVEKLVTIVRFRLNKDGSLDGEPRVVSQSGRTDANAPQVGRHAELAIRAVKLAAPFDLPEEFYQYWKSVDSRFDRNLSR